jgi:hypothetical protein
MIFIGVDAAWGDADETGVVALEPSGQVRDAGWAIGADAAAAWIRDHVEPGTLVFIDAPLVVTNPTGQRLCEAHVGQRYWLRARYLRCERRILPSGALLCLHVLLRTPLQLSLHLGHPRIDDDDARPPVTLDVTLTARLASLESDPSALARREASTAERWCPRDRRLRVALPRAASSASTTATPSTSSTSTRAYLTHRAASSVHVWDRTLERTLGRIQLLDGRDYAEVMVAAGHGTATRRVRKPHKQVASRLHPTAKCREESTSVRI